MRVLCLHGSGASAEIMRSQIANIVSLLPPSYELDFLDSPYECEAAPELKGLYPGPYYCYFTEYSPEEMQQAVEYVQEVVEEDGPYDCVIGFSQGASVAAAYIAQSQKGMAMLDSPFKMAIFMCAALIPPMIATGPELVKTIGSFGDIDLPTVHVVGQRDPCYAQTMELVKSCKHSPAQILLNGGGHDVPRDAVNVRAIAGGIERAARVAFSG